MKSLDIGLFAQRQGKKLPVGNVNDGIAARYSSAWYTRRTASFHSAIINVFNNIPSFGQSEYRLKFRSLPFLVALLAAFFFSSCGGGSSEPRPSGVNSRVFVSTPLVNGGQIYIVNANNDTVPQSHPVISVLNAGLMAVTPDKKVAAVFAASLNTLTIVDTQGEAAVGTVGLAGPTESMVGIPLPCDAGTSGCSAHETLIVAEPTAPYSGTVQNGIVQFIDLSNGSVTATLSIPQARRLVLSPDGTKLLVFSDDFSVNLVDTAAKTTTLITSTGFDHPVNAVFSTDNSTAYILSCGPECGGTTANVSALTISSGAVGAPTPVSGATVGLIDSSNHLYVAGSPASGGLLDILDPSSLTVTKSAIPIGDGYHTLMALTSKGQLFIGAKNCTNGLCMSILDTSSQTASINPCVSGTSVCPSGNVTALVPLDNRAIIYTVQGGILHIYDLKKNPPTENLTVGIPFLTLLGNLSDAEQVD